MPARLKGSSRMRRPVAAKIALAIAGVAGAIGGSPGPLGGKPLWMKRRPTAGAWPMRRVSGWRH